MAGATAATAAGITGSQAGLVTINLGNNYISGTNGNHLNADLTGDGQADVAIHNGKYYRNTLTRGGYAYHNSSAAVTLNGIYARAHFTSYPIVRLRLGSQYTGHELGYGASSLTGSIPISFKDLHINGGVLTKGSLEVTVFPTEVQLDSFTYDTRAVPDQGSSLALLAIGAGGILALRRWRAAQGRS
jgi:hypothetical protein